MTVFPEEPHLVPIEGNNEYRMLAEPHLTFVKLFFGYSLKVLIKAGYKTDGASVPSSITSDQKYRQEITRIIKTEFPNETSNGFIDDLIRKLIGTPWDMPRLLAAIVHDALYGMHWMLRLFCDKVYCWILDAADYNKARARIEYSCIRLVGWRNWDAVTDLERDRTKRLVSVEFVRTMAIPEITRQLMETNQNGSTTP